MKTYLSKVVAATTSAAIFFIVLLDSRLIVEVIVILLRWLSLKIFSRDKTITHWNFLDQGKFQKQQTYVSRSNSIFSIFIRVSVISSVIDFLLIFHEFSSD